MKPCCYCRHLTKSTKIAEKPHDAPKRRQEINNKKQRIYCLSYCVTSQALTPPPSEFGRADVIVWYHGTSSIFMVGARLGVASERIPHGWVNGSSSKRVGMRHVIEFQFEFGLY